MSFKFGFTSELGRYAAQFTVAAVGHVIKNSMSKNHDSRHGGRSYQTLYVSRIPDVDYMHLYDEIVDSVIGVKDARRRKDLKHSEVIDILDERYPEWELELESMIKTKYEGA